MNLLTFGVDFESYYDKQYSITTLGVDAYCADPRFNAYMASIHGPGVSYAGPVEEAPWDEINGHRWVSHNARFDETVWKFAAKGIQARPEVWECTADLSVYLGCPRSLAGAAEQLLGIKPDKTVRDKMLGKLPKDLNEQEQKDLVAYALDDARLCRELWEAHSDKWPAQERLIARINRACGEYGVRIDQEGLLAGMNTLKTKMWEAAKDIPWDWSGNKTPLAPTKLKMECRKTIIGTNAKGEPIALPCPKSLAADSEECAEWEAEWGDKYPWVGAMRDWRRANIMLKKLETIQKRLRPDGSFPFTIKYFGGSTGRFSGDGGFNIQNLPRGELMGVDLRGLIIARPGKTFVIVDLAQIEARITLWLARDFTSLELVKQGYSVYEVHAICNMGYDKSRGPLKKVDPKMYALAKAQVLGLGFGCGWLRFIDFSRNMLDEATFNSIFGAPVTEKEIEVFEAYIATTDRDKKIVGALEDADLSLKTQWVNSWKQVTGFRKTNPKIIDLWNEMQRDCTRSAGKSFIVELPSGRELRYFNVKSNPSLSAEVTKGERRNFLFGGKLVENLVQATARDVFAEGMVRLHEAGYRIAFHVHDEYVLEVDKGTEVGPIQALVDQAPAWLPRCPIGSEAVVSDKYLK